jgi:hypothetical protein
MNTRLSVGCVLALVVVVLGCSKEQRDQLADKVNAAKDQVTSKAQEVTKQATQKVSSAAEQVVPDGEAKIKLDSELSFSASYANLISLKDRNAVFQLRSYADKKSETLPAYFFQATASSPNLNSLSGQSLQGTMFVKKDSKVTWMSLSNQPVTLTLDSIADGKLKGRFASGQMSPPSGEASAVSGTFEAIIEGGLE